MVELFGFDNRCVASQRIQLRGEEKVNAQSHMLGWKTRGRAYNGSERALSAACGVFASFGARS
jgi:hypothetical protein